MLGEATRCVIITWEPDHHNAILGNLKPDEAGIRYRKGIFCRGKKNLFFKRKFLLVLWHFCTLAALVLFSIHATAAGQYAEEAHSGAAILSGYLKGDEGVHLSATPPLYNLFKLNLGGKPNRNFFPVYTVRDRCL